MYNFYGKHFNQDEAAHKIFSFAMDARTMPNGNEDAYCMKCGTQLQVWYCEEELYLIRCLKCKTAVLTKASNPRKAAKQTIGIKIPMAKEFCRSCNKEVYLIWDAEKDGYKAYCPKCGERLMLCNECQNDSSICCDYDYATDRCRHNEMIRACHNCKYDIKSTEKENRFECSNKNVREVIIKDGYVSCPNYEPKGAKK